MHIFNIFDMMWGRTSTREPRLCTNVTFWSKNRFQTIHPVSLTFHSGPSFTFTGEGSIYVESPAPCPPSFPSHFILHQERLHVLTYGQLSPASLLPEITLRMYTTVVHSSLRIQTPLGGSGSREFWDCCFGVSMTLGPRDSLLCG